MKLSIEYNNTGCNKLSLALSEFMNARVQGDKIHVEDSEILFVIDKTIKEMTPEEIQAFTTFFYEWMWKRCI